jgi:hypothetical protein
LGKRLFGLITEDQIRDAANWGRTLPCPLPKGCCPGKGVRSPSTRGSDYPLAISSELPGGMSKFGSDRSSLSVAIVTTQRVVTGNNCVTFRIRRAALFDAIISANKHINTYEND